MYIAQRLKRNRTLKALNLSDNKIDMNGFVAIAEALVCELTIRGRGVVTEFRRNIIQLWRV